MCNLYICFPVKGHRKTAIKNTESHLNKESQSIWNNSLDYSKLRSLCLSLNYIHKLCLGFISASFIDDKHLTMERIGMKCVRCHTTHISGDGLPLILMSIAHWYLYENLGNWLILPPHHSFVFSLSFCCSICMAGWSEAKKGWEVIR